MCTVSKKYQLMLPVPAAPQTQDVLKVSLLVFTQWNLPRFFIWLGIWVFFNTVFIFTSHIQQVLKSSQFFYTNVTCLCTYLPIPIPTILVQILFFSPLDDYICFLIGLPNVDLSQPEYIHSKAVKFIFHWHTSSHTTILLRNIQWFFISSQENLAHTAFHGLVLSSSSSAYSSIWLPQT